MSTNEIQECKLASEKRWTEIRLELQKIKDDQAVINQRLNKQAAMVNDIQELSKSTSILANNMKSMLDEQQKQNKRLEKLEQKPAKRWDNIIDKAIGIVVGAIIGYILMQLGIS